MKNFFIPYEIACELRRKGFDEECFGRFVNGELLDYKNHNQDSYHWTNEIINAPSYQQIIDWFREEWEVEIHSPVKQIEEDEYGCVVGWSGVEDWAGQYYAPTYYESLNKGLEKAIKLI